MEKIIKQYNWVFFKTNPESIISAHGLALDFLAGKYMQEKMKEAVQETDTPAQYKDFLKALKEKKFNFKNGPQMELLCDLLISMDSV